jgi:hypothetical protein
VCLPVRIRLGTVLEGSEGRADWLERHDFAAIARLAELASVPACVRADVDDAVDGEACHSARNIKRCAASSTAIGSVGLRGRRSLNSV